jgi:hypothetical protein
MARRRRAFEASLVTFEAFDEEGAVDVLAGPREEIGPALYVGQSPRLLKRGNTPDIQRYIPSRLPSSILVCTKLV